MMFFRLKNLLTYGLLGLCLFFWGQSAWIYVKAYAAKGLIALAWQKTLLDKQDHKPWPWADTWPVGKIYFPTKGRSFYVLNNVSGESLAFSPGISKEAALPDEDGAKIISGHRDTHFSVLRRLSQDDLIVLQDKHGQFKKYEITHTGIKHTRKDPFVFEPDRDMLYLITCYPFDSVVPGGPLRYVIQANPLTAPSRVVAF